MIHHLSIIQLYKHNPHPPTKLHMFVELCSFNCKIMSSRNTSSSRKTTNTQLQEESGWTTYLEDFSLAQKSQFSHDDHHHSSNSSCSPSMVSDAASYAAWKKISGKNNTTNQQNFGTLLHPSEFPRRLNFNKSSPMRNKKNSYNEELEDTASSPVNSPKVSSGKQQMFINQGTQNDVMKNGYTNEESKMSNLEHSELRKKGFCLVPVSMLVNLKN